MNSARTWAIHEDEHILVVNKPSGVLSVPDGYDPDLPHLRGELEPLYGPLWIVHRLDKETSGLVVLARSAQAHQALNDQFAERQVFKTYHALILGEPSWKVTQVDLPLMPDADRKHRTRVDRRNGKPSLTEFELIDRFEVYSLVEARPKTGRTHQIRTHLASLELPVAVDPLYGDGLPVTQVLLQADGRVGEFREVTLLDRLALHARMIRFQHPASGEMVEFRARYPKDLTRALRQLSRGK